MVGHRTLAVLLFALAAVAHTTATPAERTEHTAAHGAVHVEQSPHDISSADASSASSDSSSHPSTSSFSSSSKRAVSSSASPSPPGSARARARLVDSLHADASSASSGPAYRAARRAACGEECARAAHTALLRRAASYGAAAKAARKRVASVRPVVLIPGIGGTQIFTRLQNVQQPWAICSSTTQWGRAWLSLTKLVPMLWDCFAATMSRNFSAAKYAWSDRVGVSVAPGIGLDAINYLDPDNFVTRHESKYFAATTAGLQAAGRTSNYTLGGLPYDWRLTPAEHTWVWGRFKSQVESMVAATGLRAVIVTHSMGGPMLHYFLTRFVTAEWRNRYIHRWIAVCAPFGGAPIGIKSVLSGYNFGVPVLTNGEGLELGPNIATSYFLMPQNGSVWGSLVTTTDGRQYGPSQIGQLLEDVGIRDGKLRYEFGSYSWGSDDPGVPVQLVAGSNVPTEMAYKYDMSNTASGPVSVLKGDGDGTVPYLSAMMPATVWRWSQLLPAVTFPNVKHVDILSDDGFVQWLVKAVDT